MSKSDEGNAWELDLAELFLSRRNFLHAGLAAAGMAALGGCSSDAVRRTASGLDPIHRLQMILRQSPDHLVARSRELVQQGDIEKIVAFVRDRIGVLPAPTRGGDPLTAARWGADATLRGGAGTLRERAELLAGLLTAGGAKATVVSIERPSTVDHVALADRVATPFAPDADRLAALWKQATGGAAPWPARVADTLDDVADRVAQRLLAALPPEALQANPWPDDLPARIPAVAVESGGGTRWAIAVGKVGLVDREPAGLSTSLSPVDLPQVEVSLAVALLPPRGAVTDGSVIHEVAKGRWSAAEVAGRHIEVTFIPAAPPSDLVGQRPEAFPLRIPVLRLVRAEGGDPPPNHLGETLAMVSRSGGLYTTDEAGTSLAGPFGPVVTADSADRRRRLGQVQKLEAVADPSTFPAVEVGLTALDATGNRVEGLAATDFDVREDDRPVPFEVVANGAPAGVRLLVIYDTSGSVAETWSRPAAKASFEKTLARALTTAGGTSPFLTQVIGVGDRARPNGWAAPTEADVAAGLAAVSSNSDVWTTLGRALPASGASAAIMISDNRSSLEDPALIPELQRALGASGVPVLCVPIGQVDELSTALIVARSGGARVSPSAPDVAERLRSFAEQQVKRAATTSYRLRVRAPVSGPADRTIEVALAGRGAIRTTVRYHVPPESDRGVASGVGGVYLTISVGDRVQTRRLGGVESDGRGGLAEPIGSVAIAEANRVLDQVTAIAFEPGSPPAAILLDDAVTAAISAKAAVAEIRPSLDAVDRGKLVTAVGRAGRYPALFPALLQASAKGTSAPPEGLRVVVFTFGTDAAGKVAVTTDIVPGLNRSLPVGTDRRSAFTAALRSSLGLSLREAGAMRSSAASDLGDRPLQVVAPNEWLPDSGPWDAAHRAALKPIMTEYLGWYRLVPTTGTGPACWVVDPGTGTTVAVGALGRGAASSGCVIDVPGAGDIAGALYWLGFAGAAISIGCQVHNPVKKTTVEIYGCLGAQTAGVASAAGALFTAPNWSARATTYFVYAIGTLMGSLPDMLEGVGADPMEAPAKVVLAVIALLIGVLGNLDCGGS